MNRRYLKKGQHMNEDHWRKFEDLLSKNGLKLNRTISPETVAALVETIEAERMSNGFFIQAIKDLYGKEAKKPKVTA